MHNALYVYIAHISIPRMLTMLISRSCAFVSHTLERTKASHLLAVENVAT
jgi:hypothetical protein